MTTFALVFSSKFLQGGWCKRQLTSDCIFFASSLDPHLSWRGFRPELSPTPSRPPKKVTQSTLFYSRKRQTLINGETTSCSC
jgi:hypothetical protein